MRESKKRKKVMRDCMKHFYTGYDFFHRIVCVKLCPDITTVLTGHKTPRYLLTYCVKHFYIGYDFCLWDSLLNTFTLAMIFICGIVCVKHFYMGYDFYL